MILTEVIKREKFLKEPSLMNFPKTGNARFAEHPGKCS
jgi:hypothetical protein